VCLLLYPLQQIILPFQLSNNPIVLQNQNPKLFQSRGDFLLKKSWNIIRLSHTKTTVQETLTSDMYIICKDQLPPEDWMLGSQKQHPVQIPSAQQELDCNNKPPRTHVGCFWI
jgi:hypothetical protein